VAGGRPRGAGILALGVIVAVACVGLGIWQLERLHDRRAFNQEVRRGMSAAPVSVSEILAPGIDPADLSYRHVLLEGTYDGAHQLRLYGRTLRGEPGDHVLAPFRSLGGATFLVDRGWVPQDADLPVAPPRSVIVSGVLLPSEPDGGAIAGDGTIARIDLPGIAAALHIRLAPWYVLLQHQEPPSPLPEAAPLPELSEGPHLSYAIQWFSFAAVAVVGSVILFGRDRRPSADRTG
jgi:cytochrome oxidase assembly protein ShyY1